MSEITPNLQLPYILSAQAQKHVTHNDALRRLDALVHISVESRTRTVPPSTPEPGARYIVAAGALGDWLNQDNNLAAFQDDAWMFYAPSDGWLAWLQDEGTLSVFRSGFWQGLDENATQGAHTRLRTQEETLDLSGSSVPATILIGDRSIVLGVSVVVDQAIAGASSFDVGIAGEPDKFGGDLSIASGATNIGVIGPTAFYADTSIIVTANGGAFSAGSLKLALHEIDCGPPRI